MSDDHLDSNRIRQMAALRRAAIRTRSYCIIAVGGCLVTAAQLVFEAVRYWPKPVALGQIWPSLLYFICAIALLGLGVHFFRLARRYGRDARQSSIPPPATPPDFSQLQDGSQIARNLEEMKFED